MLNSDDKVILYNIIEREVDNFLVGVPVLSAFSTVISNYVIKKNIDAPFACMYRMIQP